MSQRKISECINVRINVGNYQHIELTKYAEESIEYSSAEERISKENQLRDELVESLMRSMKAIPEKLGKGIEEAIEVEEAIQRAIPEWLANGPVPNIANTSEKKQIQVAAEQKAQKDEATNNLAEVTTNSNSVSNATITEKEDLFEEDEMPEPSTVAAEKPVEVTKVPEKPVNEKVSKKEKKPVTDGNLDDFFEGDDDDLFGDM